MQPCGNDKAVASMGICATTHTQIEFQIEKKNPKEPVWLNFYLNDARIQTFKLEKNLKVESVKLNISNLPRSVFHKTRVDLLNSSEADGPVSSSANRSFWLLEQWSNLENIEVTPTAGGVPDGTISSSPFYAPRAGLFTEREARKIITYAKSRKDQFSATTVGEDEHIDSSYRRTSKLVVPRDGKRKTEWIYKRIESFVTRLNSHFWKYELGSSGTSPSCRLHESMQILKYESSESGFYDLHMDVGIHGYTQLRKLSVTVQLSQPEAYEGGDLQLVVGKRELVMPRSVGSAVLFPSYILHTVKPVTRGTRYALVLWFTGCSAFR